MRDVAEDPWRAIVEAQFRVYEARREALPGVGDAHLYFLMFPSEELEERYGAARRAILAEDPDAVVFLRREGGEDVLVVAPRPPVAPQGNRVNWILFALTIATTVAAGAIYWQGYKHVGGAWSWGILWSPEHLLWGTLTFALPLMAILGVHEAAHYMAARRHGLRATLPYFIPFPPFALPIGTLGAFIRLKDPLPDRKALFDVGASGPIAGFALAVPLLVAGAFLTSAEAVEVPELDVPELDVDVPFELMEQGPGEVTLRLLDPQNGTALVTVTAPDAASWSFDAEAIMQFSNGTTLRSPFSDRLDAEATRHYTVTVPANTTEATLRFTWDDHLIQFGDPLLVDAMEWFGMDNSAYLTHPTFFAGWVGLLITGINLLPAGQLDGGHVARAVFGDKTRYVAYAAIGALFYFAFQFQTWILMALFIVFMGLHHPPPLNDRVELDWKRKALAGFVLVVFVLTFVPRPIIL